jgi:hypothetical protein
MPWAGDGSRRWFVRVEHFVDEDPPDVSSAHAALVQRLVGDEGPGPGADQGTGHSSGSVIGLTFVVRADDPVSAAHVALSTAESALAARSIGLYGLTLITDTGETRQEEVGFPAIVD